MIGDIGFDDISNEIGTGHAGVRGELSIDSCGDPVVTGSVCAEQLVARINEQEFTLPPQIIIPFPDRLVEFLRRFSLEESLGDSFTIEMNAVQGIIDDVIGGDSPIDLTEPITLVEGREIVLWSGNCD